MSRFVLDCSVSAAWCLDDEASPLAEGLLQDCIAEGALGPPLWVFEMANLEITSTSAASALPAKAPRHPATPWAQANNDDPHGLAPGGMMTP